MPLISVHASHVQISTKDDQVHVYFDLTWRIEQPPEPIVKIEGDLLLSDDRGVARGRVPWNEQNAQGFDTRFEEHAVGFDASKMGGAAWLKGAAPSSLHFGYVARRVVFSSGRTARCLDCG